MPKQRPTQPVFRQLMLDYGNMDDQIVPTPCKKCGSRSLEKAPGTIPPGFTAAVSTFLCAGCGVARARPFPDRA